MLRFLFYLLPLGLLSCEAEVASLGRRGDLSRFLNALEQTTAVAEDNAAQSGNCATLCPDFRQCAEAACALSVDPLNCELLCDDAPELTVPSCEAISAAVTENTHICETLIPQTEPDAAIIDTEDAAAQENDADTEGDAAPLDDVELYNCCYVLQCMQYGESELNCELEICGICDCDFYATPNPCDLLNSAR